MNFFNHSQKCLFGHPHTMSWFHSPFGSKYDGQGCHAHMMYDHYASCMPWFFFSQYLPENVVKEIHELCMKNHKAFLDQHFDFIKKIKEVSYKIESLSIELMGHCHQKGSESFDKAKVSKILGDLMDLKKQKEALVVDEEAAWRKSINDSEKKTLDILQGFLKK